MSKQKEIIQTIKEWLGIINKQVMIIIKKAKKHYPNIIWEVAPNNSKIGIALICIEELLDDLSSHFSEKCKGDADG